MPTSSPDPWVVYLLECADGSLYCGITNNLERRLAQHNGLLRGGARCTRGRRPVALVASAMRRDRGEALKLEARVKKMPKKNKIFFLVNEGGANAGH